MTAKKFRLFDVILSVICVVFVAEAAAPVASIGNSQYFWWLFMILAFLLPYGLISCELGTAYAGDGGLYDWIRKAYPNSRWGARASWYYWINFPLWMASLAVMCPQLISTVAGVQLGTLPSIALQLGFIWIITLIALYPVCDSIVILNISAAIKIILALVLGGLGVYYVINHGFVNDMAPTSFLPSFDLHSLSYISVIIFNFLGFEVVCTYADSMRSPRRQIPLAIISGGIVISAIYLFSAFGIGAAVPVNEISPDSGLVDALIAMTGQEGGWFIAAAALLFLITLFGNMISWSMGVNSTAAYAAERGDMPALFAKRREKNNMPIGAALASGVVASVLCLGTFDGVGKQPIFSSDDKGADGILGAIVIHRDVAVLQAAVKILLFVEAVLHRLGKLGAAAAAADGIGQLVVAVVSVADHIAMVVSEKLRGVIAVSGGLIFKQNIAVVIHFSITIHPHS